MAVTGDATARQDRVGAALPRLPSAPTPPAPVRWEVTPTKAWAASATLGLCPDTCHLNLFLGTSCCQGTLLYGPGGLQTSVPIWPAGLVCWRPLPWLITALTSPCPNCHREPQVPRLGTDCIPQGLSTSLTHRWQLTETQGSLAAPLTLPEGIPSIPSCISNLLCLHRSGQDKAGQGICLQGLKKFLHTCDCRWGESSPGAQGLHPNPATEPHLSAPCLAQH